MFKLSFETITRALFETTLFVAYTIVLAYAAIHLSDALAHSQLLNKASPLVVFVVGTWVLIFAAIAGGGLGLFIHYLAGAGARHICRTRVQRHAAGAGGLILDDAVLVMSAEELKLCGEVWGETGRGMTSSHLRPITPAWLRKHYSPNQRGPAEGGRRTRRSSHMKKGAR